jgi:hypothetical protein
MVAFSENRIIPVEFPRQNYVSQRAFCRQVHFHGSNNLQSLGSLSIKAPPLDSHSLSR